MALNPYTLSHLTTHICVLVRVNVQRQTLAQWLPQNHEMLKYIMANSPIIVN